jgi:hypothetical protein
MPERTAAALARILSLSANNASDDSPPSAGPSEHYFEADTSQEQPRGGEPKRPRLDTGVAMSRSDEAGAWRQQHTDAGEQQHVESDVAWAAGKPFACHVGPSMHWGDLPGFGTELGAGTEFRLPGPVLPSALPMTPPLQDDAEGDKDHADGPANYGAFHTDPYGPEDKDEAWPGGPSPRLYWDEQADFPEAGSRPDETEAGPHNVEVSPAVTKSREVSSIPEWAFDTLPRDCLMMLLESALKHMPQEEAVVMRCMTALAPITRAEYDSLLASGIAPKQLSEAFVSCMIAKNRGTFGGAAAKSGPSAASSAEAYCALPQRASADVRHAPRCTAPAVELHSRAAYRAAAAEERPAPGALPAAKTPTNKGQTRTTIRLADSRSGTRTSILTEEQAIEVFKQRPQQRWDRAALCSELAERYSITTTAIRHIWDRRTWVWTTMPFWTKSEMEASLAEGICDACRQHKVATIEDTCPECPINRKRGRPRGARDSCLRQRKVEAFKQ